MKKIYLVAMVFAVLTAIAVYNYANHLQDSAKAEVETVVVALSKIPGGTQISADMIGLKQISVDGVHPLAVTSISQVQGKVTNMEIEANEQILSVKLNEIGEDDGGLSFVLPSGKRAMTIEVDEINGVAGYIEKGNFVDVVASLMINEKNEEGKTEKIAKTVLLLQNIMVLKVDSASAAQDDKKYTNLTLAVTPQEAVQLFYAQTNGKLSAILRPVLESDEVDLVPYFPKS